MAARAALEHRRRLPRRLDGGDRRPLRRLHRRRRDRLLQAGARPLAGVLRALPARARAARARGGEPLPRHRAGARARHSRGLDQPARGDERPASRGRARRPGRAARTSRPDPFPGSLEVDVAPSGQVPRLQDADRRRAGGGASTSATPCGATFPAGLVRVPRAWGKGGEAMAEAAFLELPYPETAVVDEDSLTEQNLALAAALPERPVVLGGCCCSHVGAVEGLATRYDRLAVVWFDAHGDLNTPESSPSGNQWGMPLPDAARLGHGAPGGRGARRRPQPRSARGRVHRGERAAHGGRRARRRARGRRRRLRRVRRGRARPGRRGRLLHARAGRLHGRRGGRDAPPGRRRSARSRASASPGSGPRRRTSRRSPGSPARSVSERLGRTTGPRKMAAWRAGST